MGLGVSPRARFPPPVRLGHTVGVALGRESVPHSLRRKRPPKPQLSASVQPLLANTSLSSHPTFTSSVYTLATASKSAGPCCCRGRLPPRPRSPQKAGQPAPGAGHGEGRTARPPSSAAGGARAFVVFSSSLVPPSATPAPFKPSVSPAQHPARSGAICMPSAVMRLGLCNKDAESRLQGLSG